MSSTGVPDASRSRSSLTNCVTLYWPLVTAALMAVVGYLTPAGVAAYTASTNVLIGILFLVLGLTLDLLELRRGSMAWHFHALLQLFSLVLSPALYYVSVYHWEWEYCPACLEPTRANAPSRRAERAHAPSLTGCGAES